MPAHDQDQLKPIQPIHPIGCLDGSRVYSRRRAGRAVFAVTLMMLVLLGSLNALVQLPPGTVKAAGVAGAAAGTAQTKYPGSIDMLAWMPDSSGILFLSDTDLYRIAANGKGLQYICSGINFILPGPAGQLLAGDGKNLLGLSLLTGTAFPISSKTPAAFNSGMQSGNGLRRAAWSINSNTAYFGSADGYIMSYDPPTGKLTALERGLDPQVISESATGLERLVFWTLSSSAQGAATGQIRIREWQSAQSGQSGQPTQPTQSGQSGQSGQPISSTSASAISFAPALPPGRSPVWLSANEIAYIASIKGNNQLVLAKVGAGAGAGTSAANATANTNTASAALTFQSDFSFLTIQLAAYEDPAEAEAFVSVCQPLCAPYPMYIVEAEVKNAKWYRVRVGIFKDKTSLNAALENILIALKNVAAWEGSYFFSTAMNDFGWLCAAPDGTFLIFSLMNAIYRYNRQDQSVVCLYAPVKFTPGINTNAILSPDGEKIAFVDDSGRLKIMSARGDQLTTILDR
jgi:WD40 repeat protein